METVTGGVRRRPSAGLATLVAVASAVAAGAAGFALAVGQREAAVGQLDRRGVLAAEAVSGEAGRYVDTLRTVAASVGGFDPLTATKFADAVPLDGTTTPRIGADESQAAAPMQAPREALRSGRATIPDAYQLTIDEICRSSSGRCRSA